MSEETSGRAIKEFKDAPEGGNETDTKPQTPRKNGRGKREGKAGGIGGVPAERSGAGGIAASPGEGAGSSGREELRANLKDKEAPKITDIIPELKGHPEIEQKIKDLGFENVLQNEWMRQNREKAKEGYKPSEKATTLASPQKDLGPEFQAGQIVHELERNKAILRNPDATLEEKTIAQTRIDEAKSRPPERTTGSVEHDDAIKAGDRKSVV